MQWNFTLFSQIKLNILSIPLKKNMYYVRLVNQTFFQLPLLMNPP